MDTKLTIDERLLFLEETVDFLYETMALFQDNNIEIVKRLNDMVKSSSGDKQQLSKIITDFEKRLRKINQEVYVMGKVMEVKVEISDEDRKLIQSKIEEGLKEQQNDKEEG